MVKKYKHRNEGNGEIGVKDDDGNSILLKPGQEIVISRKSEGNGIVIVEEDTEKKTKKNKEVNYNDSRSMD